MERQRTAALVVVAGIGLFGAAMAARAALNPWWTNVGAAVLVLAASAALLNKSLARLFEVRPGTLVVAIALAVAMVAATHVCFDVAADLLPSLRQSVDALYGDIGAQAPGQITTILLIVIVVVAEEVLWRGVAVDLCRQHLGRFSTGVLAVALYAIPQLIGGNWPLVAAAVVAGGVFTIQRLLTDGLVGPITTHAIWSSCIFSLLPLARP